MKKYRLEWRYDKKYRSEHGIAGCWLPLPADQDFETKEESEAELAILRARHPGAEWRMAVV